MADVVKWTLVIMMLFGTGITVGKVGEPRKPITGGQALFSVVFNFLLVAGILIYWDTGS